MKNKHNAKTSKQQIHRKDKNVKDFTEEKC